MKTKLFVIFAAMLCVGLLSAQQMRKFTIESFEQDPFDGTATNPKYQREDASGSLYAIV